MENDEEPNIMKARMERARLRDLRKKIARQETRIAEHRFKAQLANELHGTEIDMNSAAAEIALSRVQAASLESTAKEAEVFSGSEFALDMVNLSDNARQLYEVSKAYRSGAVTPKGQLEEIPALPVSLDKVIEHPFLQVHGLSELQIRVLYVMVHPEACADKHGDLSNESIAKFLKLPEADIASCFNQKLLEALWKETSLKLRMQKAAVDDALIESARVIGKSGDGARKQYYTLIGATKESVLDLTNQKISRERKIEIIQQNLSKLARHKITLESANG